MPGLATAIFFNIVRSLELVPDTTFFLSSSNSHVYYLDNINASLGLRYLLTLPEFDPRQRTS
jgi:hypothetical protein